MISPAGVDANIVIDLCVYGSFVTCKSKEKFFLFLHSDKNNGQIVTDH